MEKITFSKISISLLPWPALTWVEIHDLNSYNKMHQVVKKKILSKCILLNSFLTNDINATLDLARQVLQSPTTTALRSGALSPRQGSVCSEADVPYVSYTAHKPIGETGGGGCFQKLGFQNCNSIVKSLDSRPW